VTQQLQQRPALLLPAHPAVQALRLQLLLLLLLLLLLALYVLLLYCWLFMYRLDVSWLSSLSLARWGTVVAEL
jgi:hypothetical protein